MEALGRVTLVLVLGILLLVGFGVFSRVWKRVTGTREPFDDKLLRSPGESLRRKLDDLNDSLIITLMLLLFLPMAVAVMLPALGYTPTVATLIALVAGCSVPFFSSLAKYRNYSLGLRGERAVGEELNRLMLQGCHVFHDYPADPKWNIDHVIVAPSGVYAIETKTRRKRRARKGRRAHEIVFDGKALYFPHGNDAHGLDQARANATWLGRELTKATGKPVKVKPILTFPGWFITLRSKAELPVLNPKQIHGFILKDNPPQLPADQVQAIAYQLEQKCRDVVF